MYLAIVCCTDACGDISTGNGVDYIIEDSDVFEDMEKAKKWLKKQVEYYSTTYEDYEYFGYLLTFELKVEKTTKVEYEISHC